MPALADNLSRFRKNFRDGAITAIADPKVLIRLGHPGTKQPADIVSIGDTDADIDFATMGTNRARHYVITQEGLVSSYIRGGGEAEEKASDRAFDLANRIEEHYRGDGTPAGNLRTTVGGLVMWCFCTHIGPAGGYGANQPITAGRTVDVPFVFTALMRISS